MANYLIVYGTGHLVEGGAPELLQRLAETYVGPGVRFPPFDDPPPGHVIHITPERIGGVGPWTRYGYTWLPVAPGHIRERVALCWGMPFCIRR